jgi:phage tail sheath protein FI
MITLNVDKKEVAFIVADTPATLEPTGTAFVNWANNAANAAGNGSDALVSSTPYAAVYYPWGLGTNLDGAEVMVPPSMMALRTIAYSDQVSYPWFAPAGFNRGLVTGVSSVGYLTAENEFAPITLNQGQRDVLYVNKINPIAYIPGRGLVVYGQKTLNPGTTALDRINVARLINYLKYNLDNIAKPFLFEPNDQQTRTNVQTTFNSFMQTLVTLRALYDYAVICDTSNNTPERIDRNELWIDIAIKPEKAIEFIYIPIRILNTGDPLPNGGV